MKWLLLLLAMAGEPGFEALFNGRDLAGWEGDPAVWSVKDGVIVGSTDGRAIKQNTFLVYQTPHSNFVLKAEVRLRNHNSGIQFRSRRIEGVEHGIEGYQADFSEAGDRSAWGNLYEEKGRGRGVMKTPDEGWQKGKSLYRKGGWNQLEILADGDHIQLSLNGAVTIDTRDTKAASGLIALQLHAGDAMRVEFRNIRIRPLGDRK